MGDITSFQMLINGQWVDASDGGSFESINPATNEVWSRIPEATADDVNAAVEYGINDVMINTGQTCTEYSRWIVHKDVVQDVIALAKQKPKRLWWAVVMMRSWGPW